MAFTDAQKKAFTHYEELKIQIKELEAECEALQPEIIPAIAEGTEVAGNYGVFVVQKRGTWKYSPAVTRVQETIKELQAEEKAKGIAKATYKETLVYTVNKA